MATVGRSTQETTSEGQDEHHRMQVSARYAKLSVLKPKLRTTMLALNLFYLATAAVAAYLYHLKGTTHLHVGIFAGLGLQFLASRALKQNSAGLLVAFSTLTGIVGAYLVYAGVGRTMTAMDIGGVSPFLVIVLIINGLGALGHLLAVYFARCLVDAMRITVRRRRPQNLKDQ